MRPVRWPPDLRRPGKPWYECGLALPGPAFRGGGGLCWEGLITWSPGGKTCGEPWGLSSNPEADA